jgi:holliday junction DNA helicase RuvA
MIERITGTLAAVTGEAVVVDVGGVGFFVEVSAITYRDLPSVGATVVLLTHLQVREDALQLYGFSTEEERELFRLFLGVSKIGPKLALAALSSRRPIALKQALATGDAAVFSAVPGIGKKTAERLILELKDKVGDVGGPVGVTLPGSLAGADDGPLSLARAALLELGFAPVEADRLLAKVDANQPVEAIIRQALAGKAAPMQPAERSRTTRER